MLPIVLDGDFNSQLADSTGQLYEDMKSMLSVLKNDVTILNTHTQFLFAGANMIRTNTYRASVYNLNRFANVDLKDSASLITRVASLAKTAALAYVHATESNCKYHHPAYKTPRPYVVGYCGSYGASLGGNPQYTGAYGKDLTDDDLMEWHEPRVKALLAADVDFLALGSVPCAKEAAAFVDLMQHYPNVRAWITFYCYNDRVLADGTDFSSIVKYCHRTMGNQLLAIGVSCVESSLVSPLFRTIQRVTYPHVVPLIACPDKASYRCREDSTIEIIDSKEIFEPPIEEWLDTGTCFIGGCCGTVAKDIKYISTRVDKYLNKGHHGHGINNSYCNCNNMVKTKL